MKQYSRKTWCRGAFLALCAAPTLLVAIWILSRAVLGDGTWRKEDWERELSSRLGITCKVASVAYSQPGLTELTQVELCNAETGETFGRVTALEVTATPDGYAIEAFAPEMEIAQLGWLAKIMHERLLCQGTRLGRCEFSARELTLLDKTASRTLVNVQALLEPTESGPRLSASFCWPEGVDPEHALEWTLARNLDVVPPATSIAVNTNKARIPCQLTAAFWPPLQRLGPDAEFSGEVSWLLSSQGSAEVRGTIFGVDLDSLISEQFPQILSGKATVRIDKAILEDGRLVSAAGTIDVQTGGRVSRSLLAAAAEHLQLQTEASPNGSEALAYRRLACGFRIDGSELQFRGFADGENPGVLITSRTAPLLTAPQGHTASAASLARVLLPDARMQVPLASQTSGLVRLLPAPAISTASPNSQTARRSHTPTRLAPGGSSTNVIRER